MKWIVEQYIGQGNVDFFGPFGTEEKAQEFASGVIDSKVHVLYSAPHKVQLCHICGYEQGEAGWIFCSGYHDHTKPAHQKRAINK